MTVPSQPTPIYDFPILVVDDDRNICRMIVEVLGLEGYRASMTLIPLIPLGAAGPPAEVTLRALEQASEPTIILADPTTFGIPGTRALRAYLEDRERRAPHLLFVMSGLVGGLGGRGREWMDADGAITMPFTMEVLLDLIADGERMLQSRAQRPPPAFTVDC